MPLSPLRYPGGKARLIPLVERYANTCQHDRYIEPFAGGASVALHFAIRRATPVIINDKDPRLYAFWKSILSDTDVFIQRIRRTPVNMKQWYRCKEIMADVGNGSHLELGFATFFLNRCNFSGCLTANPIGGIHQRGQWRMDARFNKADMISRIQTIARYKKRIQITNLDALELMQSEARQYDFIYLDPPYYGPGKYLYKNYLAPDGHERLAAVLNDTSASWLMSYDRSPVIESLYRDQIVSMDVPVNYSFIKKMKQREMLMFSQNEAALTV